MESVGKILIIMGAGLFLLGLLLVVVGKVPGAGRLPGDIVFQRGNFTFYLPLVTMLLVSLLFTILINVILRLFRS